MEAPIKHLYIIGNGFDRYHGAKSTYWDFRGYLIRHNDFALKMFELFFGPKSMLNSFSAFDDFLYCLQYGKNLPAPKNTWACKYLWSDFEGHLSELNRERVFDFIDEALPVMDEDEADFLYSNFYAPIEMVKDVVQACTKEMQYHFHRWVNTLHYEKGFKKRMLKLDTQATFLNFNYTLFLETEYGVPSRNIEYIHGSRKGRFGSLILGHGDIDAQASFDTWIHKNRNRRRYRPNLKAKNGRYFSNDKLVYLAFFLKDEWKGNWRLTTRYYAVDLIEDYLEEYYERNIKRCADIINQHAAFFGSLHALEEITVLGHSLNEVDSSYFKAIVAQVTNPALLKWQFSYYSPSDLCRIKAFCRKMKITETNVQLIQMRDLTVC